MINSIVYVRFLIVCPFATYTVLRGKIGPKWSINKKFQKVKNIPPGIHPNYKCAKFQEDLTRFRFPSLPWRFWSIWAKWVPEAQKWNFSKIKKYLQVLTQTTSVSNFNKIWSFLGFLGCPKVLEHNDRHLDTQTDIVRF